jgi:hypothetical protein
MRGLAIACTALTACSFVTARGPKADPGAACTTTYAPPIVDAIATSAGIAATAVVNSQYSCGDGCHTFNTAPLYLIPTLVFTVSALYGCVVVSSCRDAKRAASLGPRTNSVTQGSVDAPRRW